MKILFLSFTLMITLLALLTGCSDMGDPVLTSPDGGNGATGLGFTADILPIFQANSCLNCHTGAGAQAGLDLSSYTAMTQSNSTHSPVVIANDPDGSYLVKTLEANGAPLMPQGGPALTSAEIATVRQWIFEGALEEPSSGGGGGGGGSGTYSFTNDVLPLLQAQCTGCHGSPANPAFGNLDLTTYTGITAQTGPNHAPVVIANDADNSYLIQRIEGTIGSIMPPSGQMDASQILILRTWIADGAVDDGSGGGGGPISFTTQIFPILQTRCAICHMPPDPPGGIDLTSYAALIASQVLEPGDPGDSDLYGAITDDEPEDRMPPPPNEPLTAGQIELFYQWIIEGAEDDG